jgi:hypothetical protein
MFVCPLAWMGAGQVENLCRDRALQAYRLDAEKWGINVQPYRYDMGHTGRPCIRGGVY